MPKSKRHIHAVAEETLTPPDQLPPGQKIARIKSAAGNSLYHVELPSGGPPLLVELDAKFRNAIFVRRGSYVVVDTTSLADRDNKLGGVICNIVRDERAWRKAAFWPVEFAVAKSTYQASSDDDEVNGFEQGPRDLPPSDDESD